MKQAVQQSGSYSNDVRKRIQQLKPNSGIKGKDQWKDIFQSKIGGHEKKSKREGEGRLNYMS